MTKPEPARPGADEYVLCKRSSRATLFALGAEPGVAVFQEDGVRARRFPSVAEALAYRAGLAHAEAEACAVFQLLPNGLIVPPE
jgi:hypothetical protein